MKKKPMMMMLCLATASMMAGCGAAQTAQTETQTPAETAQADTTTETEETAPAETTEAEETIASGVIYTNALFYTEDADAPEAEAMAVKDDKIVYIGAADSEELKAMEADGFEVVNLGGAFVTPNLIDAHTHPYTVGKTNWYTDFPDDVETYDDILNYIQAYCEEHPASEQPFIYFEYYPSDLFDSNGPRKEWLDEIVPDRPILVEDFSDHACWVNSKFLELLDLESAGPDADLSNFVTDENGEYTGWILEGEWTGYVSNMYDALGWAPNEDPTEEVMGYLLNDLKRWGSTAVEDGFIEDEGQLVTLKAMDEAGTLNMYYDGMVPLHNYDSIEEAIEAVKYYDATYHTNHIKVDTIKVFYDGTNELGDAALIDGWIDDPSKTGYILSDTEGTYEMIKACNENGVDIHFHMVGDLAFRQVMDATEMLVKEVGALDIQVEVCHCEYVDPSDYTRPAELGVIVNWTPHWSGGYFGEASLRYLGEERYNNMYQFNPMIESGAIVTFGSDVYSMEEENRANPYFGMQTAMTRIDIEYPLESNGGFRESEAAKLSLEKLLKGYTINAAIQLRIDDITGSLEVGKYANFNIYDENLFDVDEVAFKDVMPRAVYFEGQLISE